MRFNGHQFATANRPVRDLSRVFTWLPALVGYFAFVAEELSNREIRELKSRAQRIKPMLKVGRDGISSQFVKAVDEALMHHELVKVKFDEFKEQKKELAPGLAQSVAATQVMAVGHVVVLFRRKPPTGETTPVSS